ncbi:MAG TPA: DUF1634 domain-containing protein [Tepidisphaeraceae bacterium]|nr:DUF1634 domain-containing protein [Tepidisphaeraceae bacterium]
MIQQSKSSKVGEIEILISDILRAGVVISFAIILIGTIITFARHPDYARDPNELKRLTSPGAAFPHSAKEVLIGLLSLQGRSIVIVGLIVLVATPVVRVAVSIFAFIHERDRVFVVITSIVLALLILSFFLGRVEG